jgi:hypothetical protein
VCAVGKVRTGGREGRKEGWRKGRKEGWRKGKRRE